MPSVPEAMMTKDRLPLPCDDPEEMLFRRVPPKLWDDEHVELDTVELPDMSVNRGSLGPAAWARLADHGYPNWGVIGFRVGDVPPEFEYRGVYAYATRVCHSPLKYNYPHSEVRAFEAPTGPRGPEAPIDKKLLDKLVDATPEVYQRWREHIRRRCRIVLRPDQEG